MREGDSVLKEELYEVAAKSMEGALAEEEEEDCKGRGLQSRSGVPGS